jgi:imidazolonepropionase-like amidohydrolase
MMLSFVSIVDLHSHLGVDSAPGLEGASDTNSLKGPSLPWLRSLDGLNTHDDAYALSIAGGVTTALVLPGSANAIG